MNHPFIIFRSIMLLTVYFSIYTFSYLGEWSFLPFYLMITTYIFVNSAVVLMVFGLWKFVKQAIESKEKRFPDYKYWPVYSMIDLATFPLISAIYSFNGFNDMVPVFYVAILSLFGVFATIRMRLQLKES